MTEQERQVADQELERALAALGSRIAYPPTPDLSSLVRLRLARGRKRQRLPARLLSSRGRRLALGLAMLVLALSATLLISSAARTAIAGWFGVRGLVITHVTAVPTLPPGTNLWLGEPLPLAEAQQRVPFRVLVPTLAELSTPDGVYVQATPPGGQVALIYGARPDLPAAAETGVGLLLTQFRGEMVEPGVLQKGLGPGTRAEPVTVNGGPGFWIDGKPHLLFYQDAEGHIRSESLRLAGNTLIWEQAGLTLRLESALGKEKVLQIAASVR